MRPKRGGCCAAKQGGTAGEPPVPVAFAIGMGGFCYTGSKGGLL
ncbi:hypothetical protein KKC1_25600 [Calderihabitans maritimus]|uniref:Uncharacterized protein n=1 Tax=Calderihabitans maritimus TaxID=1246530 RepID=A0A1Z5HV68_9FIRM|nr:hypothetical protein KKC1_25600 [Calderihabitans maritimus]